jgi:hypothetical protein
MVKRLLYLTEVGMESPTPGAEEAALSVGQVEDRGETG